MSDATPRGNPFEGTPQQIRYFKLTGAFEEDEDTGLQRAACHFIFWRADAMTESSATDYVYDPPVMFDSAGSGDYGYAYWFPGLGKYVIFQMGC